MTVAMIEKTRPINLNLMTIRFPITAIVSILHRLSGVLLFLGVPLLLWAFSYSLSSPDDFAFISSQLSKFSIKLILWGFLTALVYHLIAGIRHFIMDFGFGESLKGGRIGAYLTFILTILFSILLGILLW
jgi:succinate dehydrogenase / fumarate reductase cytochrome b subunit